MAVCDGYASVAPIWWLLPTRPAAAKTPLKSRGPHPDSAYSSLDHSHGTKMLKKIPIAELRLGMHLHAVEGSWLDHPFWRSKFVLTKVADLQSLRTSSLTHCWIDSEKSLASAATPPGDETQNSAETLFAPFVLSGDTSGRAATAAEDSVPFDEELKQAARLCRKSKEVVKQLFGDVRMGKTFDPQCIRPMVAELAASVFRNPGALISLTRLKTKDDYTYMHSVAVCALMIAFARELGMDVEACRDAGLAGLLHDVGKTSMPLEILNKLGKLSEAEFAVMRSHPERGHELLIKTGTAGLAALDVCLHHHERVDGTGYPRGLLSGEISLLARMAAICDVYDAISSSRPYKFAWDPADSIARMASWVGHFDPEVFPVFVRSLGIYPSGSLVRLQSGRLAVVVKQHPKDLTVPTVKAFFSTKANMPIAVVRIDLSRREAHDAIVCREPRGSWNFPNLEALWAGESSQT